MYPSIPRQFRMEASDELASLPNHDCAERVFISRAEGTVRRRRSGDAL